MAKNLVYDIHDKPKFGSMLIFALQQVLAILAATIAVPAIIGLPTQMPAAIFGAGVGTLIYQLFTKRKSPVFLGSSFAFLSSLFVALAYGYAGIVLGSVIAGLVYVVIALIIRFVGTEWVNKLMPPVIIGPTVAVIGLSLAGNAMGDMVKSNAIAVPALPSHEIVGSPIASYNLIALLCGLVTFFVVVICSTQKRRQMPRLIPFIIGIAAGYVTASVFTVIGTVASGDQFIHTQEQKTFIRETFGASAAEMEGGSIGHVCTVNKVPFAVLRTISDGDGAAMDYAEFAPKAAMQSIEVIMEALKLL